MPSCADWNLRRPTKRPICCYLVFSTRARVVTGEMPKSDAASYLSGLIVGKDVATAAALFDLGAKVPLVCAPGLTALYARALAAYDVQSHGH